ncbi:hypothetical protein PoB_007400500 [Plakobranchus ocellatus]|uniref:Uncharacterized protein n=1 Tax=Plakobranchus ocellatus TaxID=259542 RepID=A0AAV4DTM2_9GAST|nr:hypothetical protein PoB_007400500 [Plakobranchus ocellatus]
MRIPSHLPSRVPFLPLQVEYCVTTLAECSDDWKALAVLRSGSLSEDYPETSATVGTDHSKPQQIVKDHTDHKGPPTDRSRPQQILKDHADHNGPPTDHSRLQQIVVDNDRPQQTIRVNNRP